MRPHQGRAEGQENLPRPAAHTPPHAPQDPIPASVLNLLWRTRSKQTATHSCSTIHARLPPPAPTISVPAFSPHCLWRGEHPRNIASVGRPLLMGTVLLGLQNSAVAHGAENTRRTLPTSDGHSSWAPCSSACCCPQLPSSLHLPFQPLPFCDSVIPALNFLCCHAGHSFSSASLLLDPHCPL